MKRDIIVCLTIIVLIVFLNIITQKYTNKATLETINHLETLKKHIQVKQEENIIMDEIKNTEKKWEEVNKIMPYYIEHDELEKVKAELKEIKGNLEIKEYETAIPLIDKTIFILDHISEKMSFNLKNVF